MKETTSQKIINLSQNTMFKINLLLNINYHKCELNKNKNKTVRVVRMRETCDWTLNLQQKIIVSNNLTTCCSAVGTVNILLDVSYLLCWNMSLTRLMRRKFTTPCWNKPIIKYIDNMMVSPYYQTIPIVTKRWKVKSYPQTKI